MLSIRKERARATLRAALLGMLEILREEAGDHIDGVAGDLSMMAHDQDSEGTFAALRGDLVLVQETL